jgi:hypothetical protein
MKSSVSCRPEVATWLKLIRPTFTPVAIIELTHVRGPLSAFQLFQIGYGSLSPQSLKHFGECRTATGSGQTSVVATTIS